jgi:hypothetical protein
LGRYTMRKMFDLEPFPIWTPPPPSPPIFREWQTRLRQVRRYLTDKLTKNSVPKKEEPNEQ